MTWGNMLTGLGLDLSASKTSASFTSQQSSNCLAALKHFYCEAAASADELELLRLAEGMLDQHGHGGLMDALRDLILNGEAPPFSHVVWDELRRVTIDDMSKSP